MTNPLVTRNAQIAIKLESVKGTAESLSASDATMTVFNPHYEADVASEQRKPASGTMTKRAPVKGRRMAKITFDVDLGGSGTVSTSATGVCASPPRLRASWSRSPVPKPFSVSCGLT